MVPQFRRVRFSTARRTSIAPTFPPSRRHRLAARRVNTTLPIHVVVGGERNTTAEARFEALGAKILPVNIIPPPPWTSTFHKASFQRLSALSFTQFEKVVVMDNDMVLLGNIDDIAAAEARASAPARAPRPPRALPSSFNTAWTQRGRRPVLSSTQLRHSCSSSASGAPSPAGSSFSDLTPPSLSVAQ